MDGIKRKIGGLWNKRNMATGAPKLVEDPKPPFDNSKVPPEVWAQIVEYVPTKDLGRLSMCNTTFRNAVSDELKSVRRREQFLAAHMKDSFYGPREWTDLFPEARIEGFPACTIQITPYLMQCILEKTHILIGVPELFDGAPLSIRCCRNNLFRDVKFMNRQDNQLWYAKESFDRTPIEPGYYLIPNSTEKKDAKFYFENDYIVSPARILTLALCLYQKRIGISMRPMRNEGILCCQPEVFKNGESHEIMVSISRKYGIVLETYEEGNPTVFIMMEKAFLKRL